MQFGSVKHQSARLKVKRGDKEFDIGLQAYYHQNPLNNFLGNCVVFCNRLRWWKVRKYYYVSLAEAIKLQFKEWFLPLCKLIHIQVNDG